MSVSKFTSSSGLNDFNLNIQATYSTITFDAEKSQGSYSIASSSNDTTIDFYAYASDGSLAGFTNNKSFTATRNFNKMVILGGTIGDVIGFTYKTTYATSQETAETTAGPYITGVSPSSLPNVNNTITVTGGNFASGITATFIGTDAVPRSAKSIVVGTPQSLIITRPDVFPPSASPYSLVLSNPGVSDPTGSAANILSNAITAGAAPSWTTASGVIGVFSKNVPFSATVLATDADGGSSITYSVVSGYSLPAGLSLGSATGIINGTPTTSTGPVSVNLRATDSGGNYVDRSFTLSDSGPVWLTAGSLTAFTKNVAYSYQLSASDDSGTAPTYTLVSGTLPGGLTVSSSGLISGTPTTSTTVTGLIFGATDANGTTTNSSSITMPDSGPVWVTSGSITGVGNGSAYSYQLSATDDSGTAPTYGLVSGTFPSGISLSSSGLISGTASGITGSTGTLNFVFSATDANGTVTNSGVISLPTSIYTYTTNTFTTQGSYGLTGPSTVSYGAIPSSYISVPYTGIQKWFPPGAGTYQITAVGAQGGSASYAGGYGAQVVNTYTITDPSIPWWILVGQIGGFFNTSQCGGGGGASIVSIGSDYATSTLITAAGGGGGGSADGNQSGNAGQASTTGGGISGGTSGQGGYGGGGSEVGAGGGGWLSAGSGSYAGVRIQQNNGSLGAASTYGSGYTTANVGGFPGGAAGWGAAGGGGGYSGGGGRVAATSRSAGGGGGSYYAGTFNSWTAGVNGTANQGTYGGSNGYITIAKIA